MSGGRLVLPADLVMSPVRTLSAQLRASLGGEDDDFVLSRPRHRYRGLVVSADTVRLLESFREPTTIPEAILLHAVRSSADATQLLTEAYPVLRQLRDARYLVGPAQAALSANRPLFDPGAALGRWQVEYSLQTFDDSDVYCATHDAERVAVKVVRPGAPTQTLRLLQRERSALDVLESRGVPGPRVIAAHLDLEDAPDDPPWLALSWVPGQTADAVAARLRHTGGPASADLFRLCHAVVRAYQNLHEAGVLHGDVHPRNMLVADDGSVTLLDFALAAVLDGAGPGVTRQRGGIGWAFEPELAASGLRQDGDVPVTAAAEQYSLAAVCFFLLTGQHHVDIPADKTAMFRQILTSDSKRLSSVAQVAPLEFADPAFARALAHTPLDRFPDLSGFAAAMAAQGAALTTGDKDRPDLWAAPLVHRLATAPSAAEFAHFPAPVSTISYGAAGIALGLVRLAQLRQDPELLAAAECWNALALTSQPDGRAVFNPALGITADSVSATSLYHSATGVQLIEALLGQAAGDFDRAIRATRRFLDAAGPPAPSGELMNGEAGLIVGATQLARALRTPTTLPTGRSVLAWLRPRMVALAESTLAALQEPDPPLGLAHGLSGPVLAVLEAEAAFDVGPPTFGPQLAATLAEQLAGRPVDRWALSPGLAHSWCNGSAGAALALAVAARHIGDERCRQLAFEFGRHAAGYAGKNASLCCGMAGISYVLLYLNSLSLNGLGGDPFWAAAAQRMADRARSRAELSGPQAHSLHKGALGAAILADEVRHPDRAWFPGLLAEIPCR